MFVKKYRYRKNKFSGIGISIGIPKTSKKKKFGVGYLIPENEPILHP
jgi:hypothetical protein